MIWRFGCTSIKPSLCPAPTWWWNGSDWLVETMENQASCWNIVQHQTYRTTVRSVSYRRWWGKQSRREATCMELECQKVAHMITLQSHKPKYRLNMVLKNWVSKNLYVHNIYLYTYIVLCVYINVYICIYIYTYIHIYIYTYIHIWHPTELWKTKKRST